MKLKDMPLDERTKTVVLLEHIEERETKKPGNFFCNLTISDGESQVDAKLWGTKKDEVKVPESSLMQAEIYPKLYNGERSYEVYSYGQAPAGYKVEDFVIHAPYEGEAMFQDILSVMDKSIRPEDEAAGYMPLSELVKALYYEHHDDLIVWSAAKKMHHAYQGGLLYHTMRMVRAASLMCRVYSVDTELLLCATALHDIGKLQELATDRLGVADYTVDGDLEQHSLLGIMMIDKKADQMNTDALSSGRPTLHPEKVKMLEHCLASHHGELEYGAITLPAIPEASLLHEIDMIDSRQEVFDEVYETIEPGEMGDRNPALGTSAYRPKYD